MSKPLVSVVVITYNHENYIKQSLDSLLGQQTNFDFEVVVGEDNSTDNTLELCKSYGDKINLIYSDSNVGMIPNFVRTLKACKGKYIAICEGDDFWIDPLKLQKQVDFLEANEDYVICWTNYNILQENGDIKPTNFGYTEDQIEINFDTIFKPYSTHTLTTLFERDALNLEVYESLNYQKDNTLYILILQNGKGAFLNFVSSTYRIHEGGVYSLKSRYFKNFSSYQNVKEVMDVVPESHTKNMKRVLRSLGDAAAFGVLKMIKKGEETTEAQIQFMKDHVRQGDLRTKWKYFKKRFLK